MQLREQLGPGHLPAFTGQSRGRAIDLLLSRAAVRQKGPYSPTVIAWLTQRASPRIAELVEARPARYNADARELLRLAKGGGAVM